MANTWTGFRASSFIILLLLVVSVSPSAHAQENQSHNSQRQALYLMTHIPPSSAPAMPETNQNRPVMFNAGWQKSVASKSAQLLSLAQKLNAEVTRSNQNRLSSATMKDAAAIEKLAKSIKSSMQMGY